MSFSWVLFNNLRIALFLATSLEVRALFIRFACALINPSLHSSLRLFRVLLLLEFFIKLRHLLVDQLLLLHFVILPCFNLNLESSLLGVKVNVVREILRHKLLFKNILLIIKMSSLGVAEETPAMVPPNTQPKRQIGEDGDPIMTQVMNPNKMNYKLHWRLSRGDYDLCAGMLNKWKLQSCKNYEYGHYLQAILHRKKGNLNEALKSIKLCHLIDPNNPIFIKELAKTFCILGKQKTALNVLKNSADSSTDWELLEQLGDIYFFLNDNESAKASYTKAYQLNANKSIILKLGKLYLKEGQTGQTQKLFDDYAEKNMLDSQILEELGFIYLSMNNKPEALYYLGQAIVQNPQNQDILLSLGSISQEYGDTEGALQRYREFYEENQNSSEMWSNLGNCYLEKDIYVTALSCFKRALYLSPLEWGIYFNLGLVYMHLGVWSIAFHYFLTSIKYNPSNGEAYMLLAVCLNKLEDPSNSYNAFEKACNLDPNNPTIYLNFAIFLAEHMKEIPNNRQLAIEKFQKHDELYKKAGKFTDPQVEAQRSTVKAILQIDRNY